MEKTEVEVTELTISTLSMLCKEVFPVYHTLKLALWLPAAYSARAYSPSVVLRETVIWPTSCLRRTCFLPVV